MKQIIMSIFCLSLFTLSALAQDTPAADNTSKNQRDRSGETATSGDQSNSQKDVKIITANGTVTLRGPVNNDAEKAKIAELAQSAAGNTKIDNQLEVKTSN